MFATSANLINLAAIGASIGIDDALRTYLALVDDVDGAPASGQILRITR